MAAPGSGTPAGCLNSHVRARDLLRSSQSRCGRLRLSNLDQELAEILTLQEADKSCWRLLQSNDHIFSILQLALAHPTADITEKVRCLGREIRDNEAAQRQALNEDGAHHQRGAVGSGWQTGIVVVRDQTADRHPREVVQQWEDGVPDRAADILEINIDALR